MHKTFPSAPIFPSLPTPPHQPTQASPLLTTGSLSHESVSTLLLAFPDKSILNCVFFSKAEVLGLKEKVFSFLMQPTSMPRPSPEVVFSSGQRRSSAPRARQCPGPGALGRQPLPPWEPGPPEQRLRPGIRHPPRGADRLQNVAIKWELPRLQGDINCH